MSELTAKHRSGVADTIMRSVACSATVGSSSSITSRAFDPEPTGSPDSASHAGQRRGQPRGELS